MLRQLLTVAVFVVGSVVATGCGDDPRPMYADFRWQVQCELMGMCSGIPPRNIEHLDGEEGHEIDCTVEDRAASQVLSFTVYGPDRAYGIAGSSIVFPAGGGPVQGTGCALTVEEDNTYVGSCGANPPTADTPCRITGITVTEEPDGPTVAGNILCIGIPARADMTRLREVTGQRAVVDPTAPENAAPASFRLVNCSGL